MDDAAARIYPLSTDGGFPQVSFDLDAELPEQFARGIPRCIIKADAIPELAVSLIADRDAKLQAEVNRDQETIDSPDDLQAALNATNPFVRSLALTRVLAKVPTNRGAFVPVIAAAVHDPHIHPRLTAVGVLSIINDDAAVAAIKPAAGDRDPYIRAIAVLALLRHGQSLPIDQVKETLDFDSGRYPFQVESSVAAFARWTATSSRRPWRRGPMEQSFGSCWSIRRICCSMTIKNSFPGSASRCGGIPRRPACCWPPTTHTNRSAAILPPTLPVTCSALPAPRCCPCSTRPCRAGTAWCGPTRRRACGAIGDAAAIPHLIRALDLESGLSRASIVWALGELKAREALPRLTAMYVDVHRDENHRGAGFLAGNLASQFQSQMDDLHDAIDSAGAWDELIAAGRPGPIDPRHNERLLNARTILDAIARIGPEASQDFYRMLAAEADRDAREEAACRLGEVPAAKAQNEPILRNLLAETDQAVRMAAAVSLLLLGETDVRKPILDWLRASTTWPHNDAIVRQLDRVKEGRLLVFARAAIENLAAEKRNRRAFGTAVSLEEQLLQRIPQQE